MKLITIVLVVIIKIIFPEKYLNIIIEKSKITKSLIVKNRIIKKAFEICSFPIVFVSTIFSSMLKIILLWILPINLYSNLKYVRKQFYTDVVVLKNISILTAFQRSLLLIKLFTKGSEKCISPGEKNPDKVFYVIRPYYFLEPNKFILNNVANLLTQYYYCLQKLSYAIESGYIPVVDWENYGRLPHSENYPIHGTKNSWEYYWKQPSDYTLDEVYSSKNVILSTQNIGQFGYIPNCAMTSPFNSYAVQVQNLCPQYAKYVPFNDFTFSYIEEKYRSLFPKEGKVLGCVIRGSSYGISSTQFSSHPVQISINELIDEIHKYLAMWNCNYVFFMNEIKEFADCIKKEFGDKAIILPRLRDSLYRKTDGSELNPMYKDGAKFQSNLDYITEVALLSKCDSLIGSMSSGTRMALILNQKQYRHVVIFEGGLW